MYVCRQVDRYVGYGCVCVCVYVCMYVCMCVSTIYWYLFSDHCWIDGELVPPGARANCSSTDNCNECFCTCPDSGSFANRVCTKRYCKVPADSKKWPS